MAATGEDLTKSGVMSMDNAKQYWQSILSGDKTKTMEAAAPAINAATDQADAARREQGEMGTSRGGGTNSFNQAAESKRMSDINNIVAAQAPEAAKGVATVGTAEANVGQQQLGKALQELGLTKDVADEIVNSSITSRPISIKANQAVVQQWSNALAALGL